MFLLKSGENKYKIFPQINHFDYINLLTNINKQFNVDL